MICFTPFILESRSWLFARDLGNTDGTEQNRYGVFLYVSSTACWVWDMMTSSNGTIFRDTGPLCGEFTGPGEFPAQWPVTSSFDVFFDLRLNKRLSKQPWGWWFETPSWSLWRQCNGIAKTPTGCPAVREKSGKFQTWQKSGKSQGILLKVREKMNIGKSQGICI